MINKNPKDNPALQIRSAEPENLRKKILAVWYMFYLIGKQIVIFEWKLNPEFKFSLKTHH